MCRGQLWCWRQVLWVLASCTSKKLAALPSQHQTAQDAWRPSPRMLPGVLTSLCVHCCLFPPLLQVVINCGALNCLLNLLTANHKKSIKKEACWTISNITAGTKEQIQAVIDSQLVSPLVHLLGVSAAQLASRVSACRAAQRNAQLAR